MGITNVYSNAVGQLLIIYSAFIIYVRKDENMPQQYIRYL